MSVDRDALPTGVIGEEDERLRAVFAPFTRTDAERTWLDVVKIILLAPLIPLRVCLLFGLMVAYNVFLRCVFPFGLPEDMSTYTSSHFQRRAVYHSGWVASRSLLFVLGFWRVNVEYADGAVPLPVDKVPPTIIANHMSYIDILAVGSLYGGMSFLAKRTCLNVPGVSFPLRALRSLYVDRDAVRGGNTAAIVKRMQGVDGSGVQRTPLVIFPEGTTTNGTALIRFKAGAFVAGLPVQPVLIRFNHTKFNPSWESILIHHHLFGMLTQVYNSLTITVLPVYTPTEEEATSPQTYAANVHNYMAKKLDIPATNHSYKEKMLYHSYLRRQKTLGEMMDAASKMEL